MDPRRKPLNDSNIPVPYPGAPSTPRRYSLTDGPSVSPDSSFESVKLDQGVVNTQRFSRISPVRTPSLSTVPEASDENSITDKSSLSRRSSSSSGQHDRLPRPHWSSDYTSLPTINSGEPLYWDGLRSEDREDPFSDPQQSAPAQPQSTVRPVGSTQSGHNYPQLASSWNFTSRPVSSYSAISSASSLHPNSIGHASQHSQLDPETAGSVDHFSHDTEAYASGMYSRASYRPPRSRSPTPAVDDEDYQIVGNTSVHYTGASPQRHSETYDPNQDYEDGDDDDDEYDEEEDLEDDEKYAWQQEGVAQDITYQAPYVYANGAYTYSDAKFYSASDGSSLSAPPYEPDTPVETRHFGPAPVGRVLRRHKTKKRVQLTNGNLVVDLDVPPRLALPRRGEPEMMKMRYTAVTCDPDEFERRGFFLRQNESRRTTELFIVITMYNEDEVLFCRTIYGVMRNISHLCTRKNSRTWGHDAWKKVVVCIVADGRKKVHQRVLDCLTLLGVYQPGDHMKNMVNNKPVTAHLFEYTTSFALDDEQRFRYPDKGIVPTQIIFCMKEKNQKKINSHRWFFNAFAPMLQPNVCVLLDVGTRPSNKSIYHLWKTFDLNSNVAGACGEIAAYKGKNWRALLNPLVAGQNFEYKIATILDKPMESLFGYISVLPGAFSAYRYIALQNDKHGVGPLASYFKGEILHGADTDIFTSNMYLAEDRILCFELVAKAKSSWILKYVKSAIAETDVPDALPEFIGQRRRWLNGSFFAATYAIAHVGQILRSGHSLSRKLLLVNETIYNAINLVAAWFAIGNFYVFFVILTSSLEDPSFNMTGIKYLNAVTQFLMAGLVAGCFLFSMGNKPQSSRWKYKLTAIMFALLMVYEIFAAVMCSVQAASAGGTTESVMLFSVCITYGVYTFSSLLAFDPWHMLTSFVPYLLLSPTYINILSIYAFSNLDDMSWGTKQDMDVDSDLGAVIQNSNSQVDVEMLTDIADVNGIYEDALDNLKTRKPVANPRVNVMPSPAEKEAAAKDYYANVRTNVLLTWVLSNALLIVGILGGSNPTTTFTSDGFTRTKAYMTFILVFVAMTTLVRFLASTMYLVARIFTG